MLKDYDPILNAYQEAQKEFCAYHGVTQYIKEAGMDANIHLLSIGKAACGMADSALKAMPGRIVDGFVLTKHGMSSGNQSPLEVTEAGHPIPDEDSIRHTGRILEWLQSLHPDSTLVVLISGGGSALFEYPANGLPFKRLQAAHAALVNGGVDIRDMNRQREELSMVKGGKALGFVACGNLHVLMLSDVPGHDPRVIASGPFTPSGFPPEHFPGKIVKSCIKGTNLFHKVVGTNRDLIMMLQSHLRAADFHAQTGGFEHFGSICDFPEYVTRQIHRYQNEAGPFALIMGGEMPVKVSGKGKGGRCMHLALLLAETLSMYRSWRMYCLATDGNDYLPGIAGGYCDAGTLQELHTQGIDHLQALSDCDSYVALNSVGNIIPSREPITNVNDIYILARFA